MKGNLSKKKGFLGQLDETDLSSIADILEERYDGRLDAAEIKTNKVNEINTQLPSKEKYPSEYAVAEVIKTTQDQADEGIRNLYEFISSAYVSFSSLDNELRDYYTKKRNRPKKPK